jgi:type IV pilus assembly protein PilC
MPLSSLATMCRALATMLDSGVSLLNALKVIERQQRTNFAERSVKQITDDVRKGTELAAAFREQHPYYPELMVEMIEVAERTGSLPEVLSGLADHYENLIRLRKTFIGAIAWPLLQLIAAVFIIAGLILVLGMIADSQGSGRPQFDPLGFGLFGASGALWWLACCFGAAAAVFVAYQLLVRGFRQGRAIHSLLLAVPVVGDCMRAFAIARFSWAYALTQQAGMEVKASLEASLRATNNGAFIAASPQIIAAVMAGEEFTESLRITGLFPRQFLEMVSVGERSGTVPETLQRLSPQFEEQARRSLAALSVTLSVAIWVLVASMIIFLIFRLAMFYVDMINKAAAGQF